jgi:translation initiation factor 3 subunit E
MYDKSQVLKAELDILQKTKMLDTVIDVYQVVNKEAPLQELTNQKDAIKQQIDQLVTSCGPLFDILKDEQAVKNLRSSNEFTLANLQGVDASMLDSLYTLAKLKFETGQYEDAAALLDDVKLLYLGENNTVASEKAYRAAWGKLAAEILSALKSNNTQSQWDAAWDDLHELKDLIDNTRQFESPLQQLEHRTWWIHWSLFVFWNHPNGRNGIIDQFFQDKYVSSIQNSSSWILRYLAVAVVINKKRRSQLKELVKVIEQEAYTYTDPILRFLANLYIKVDFESAQSELANCAIVMQNDYFLNTFTSDFLENARIFIFESYVRIHRVIDLDSLSKKLGMDDTERWIANLIRNARYSAKIDSQTKRVIMAEQSPNIYQQIVEKTEGATYRSNMLQKNVFNLERRLKAQESNGTV